MSGSWYSIAIAASTGAIFSLVNGLQQTPPVQDLQALLPGPDVLSGPKLSGPNTLLWPNTQNTQNTQSATLPRQASTTLGQASPEEASPEETSPEKTSPKEAERSYQRAMELANQGVVAYQAAQSALASDPDLSLGFTRRERFLWQAALAKLESIPPSADSYKQAQIKIDQYKGLLATTDRKLEAWDNDFLGPIIRSAGVPPDRVHLTVCQIDEQRADSTTSESIKPESTEGQLDRAGCRHHQGDQQLASPASLIKLPIAIALLDKTTREHIPLSQSIYVEPQNFTENADGATVTVDQEYTLAQVMTAMINESNNIATNQLIDYVGRESIAKTLADRGYQNTLVDHKLAGERILPPNPGTQSNQTTSDDITAMMATVYSLENPGDEAILTALLTQQDREIGHQALADMGPAVQWLGEKTGQNSRVIGASIAMKIGPERYALTVAIDNSGNIEGLRKIISGVASYLLAEGALISDPQL